MLAVRRREPRFEEKEEAMALEQIEHVVVLMLENRSLDNMLGWLYADGEGPAHVLPPDSSPTFDGLRPEMVNPRVIGDPTQGTVEVMLGAPSTLTPKPDPQELFDHFTFQIFGPDAPSPKPRYPMKGFVHDYATTGTDNADQIMACHTPAQLPVLSALAKSYAVSDAWFCSVPCQTWPNRAFVHAGTSNGHVNNGSVPDPLEWDVRTIFGVLDDMKQSWAVYSDAFVAPSLTRTMFPSLWGEQHGANFKRFADFVAACGSGFLPRYSFIEPSFLLDPNDQHPPHDVSAGEALLLRVWSALSSSDAWSRTLLIIIYDEHGGTFDHVLPPFGATPPDAKSRPGDDGFAFDRFGVRVPCVVASPWIEAGTVFRAPAGGPPFDHTSILATLRDWLQIPAGQMLTSARVAAAPTLGSLLTRTTPRDDLPTMPSPVDSHCQPSLDEPPNDLQRSLVAAAARRMGRDPAQTLNAMPTRRHMVEFFVHALGAPTPPGASTPATGA
jgi:phospholipase C